MIYDRTQEDVNNAAQIIRGKLQQGQELTNEDIDILERGTITLDTINRIEQTQNELWQNFISSSYFGEKPKNKIWSENEIFKLSDFERLISNGELLRNAFFFYSYTPQKALPKYTFEQLNAMERLLHDLQENYKYMVSHWKKCGIYRCGGVING